jgi:DNA-binding MarR family transcriptional regulator
MTACCHGWKPMSRQRVAAALAELTLESFRLNGLLLAEGDRMARPEGLTSAGWQVLGTLMLAGEPLTIAGIARRMGLTRQSIQRVADVLATRGLIRYQPNPAHPLWQLAGPSPQGRALHRRLERRRQRWAGSLVADMELAELESAAELIRRVRQRIGSRSPATPPPGSR